MAGISHSNVYGTLRRVWALQHQAPEPKPMISTADLSQLSAQAGRHTFVFTVRRVGQGWLVQDSQGAILGRSANRDDAIQCARRSSVLMSETGVRVIVMLEIICANSTPSSLPSHCRAPGPSA